jgi:hypothetical protein
VLSLENILCVDFEASGLGPGSYPIEAALVDCQSTACTSWLIRPTDDWRAQGIWSEDASALHKIALSDLLPHGQPAQKVARELADRCMGKTILCDGGDHDRRWLITLFQTIDKRPPFELTDHSAFVCELAARSGRRPEIAVNRSELEALSRFPVLHRAGPDARRLAEVARLLAGYP